jgi:hypothetical protein
MFVLKKSSKYKKYIFFPEHCMKVLAQQSTLKNTQENL